jgi:beta-mannanase
MNDSLTRLESKRKALYKKLEEVGDFRRGSISVNYRKCGKKNCACATSGHPGHGPQYLWSTTVKGKSYAKNLKLGPELQKYLEENGNYQSFMKLCDEIVQVNEKICDCRPIIEIADKHEGEELKKKLQMHFMRRYRKRLSGL